MTRTKKEPKVTEVQLVYRHKCKAEERQAITTSRHAYDLFIDSWEDGKLELQEQFRIMMLDNNNRCMGISTLSTGGIKSCPVDLRLAFATALKARAAAVIIAHNHPSGSVTPSDHDRRLTDRFAAAGKVLDVPVLDHLVVTRKSYASFADEGLV